jgi:exo-beta-1,3-glucanase (GH17 family)
MNHAFLIARVSGRIRIWITAVLAAAVTLVACGGGLISPETSTVAAPATRPLPSDFASRKAVAYSPFRSAQSEPERAQEVITADMIQQDLTLLAQGGFGLIRLFDSSDKVAKLTLQVIRDNRLDIKVMLGAWISPDAAASHAEVARAIALANAFPDTVAAVSVGNEAMVSWSFHKIDPVAMRSYIRAVRQAIRQPVTTDDNWAFFAKAYAYEADPSVVLPEIDFVAMHTYPLLDTVYNPGLWDFRQSQVPASRRAAAMMDAAIASAKREYSAVRSHLDQLGFTGLPIIIGETGWKADPASVVGRAHPVNQKMYVDRLAAWKAEGLGPKSIVYFEAFDEPWKQGDDKWGLFTVERKARYVVRGLYPSSMWDAGNYTDADAAYVVPLNIRAAIDQARYTVYADVAAPPEARPALSGWQAWDGNTATLTEGSAHPSPSDGPKSLSITPTPKPWGWGAFVALPTNEADNLSRYANGKLNFSVRTLYPGKLEVGFYVGSLTDGSAFDAYLPIAAGEYGYVNDGNWQQVSIPVADIRNRVAQRDGVALSRIDLGRVTAPLVIADRFAVTGKAPGTAVSSPIQIDRVYWSD